MDLKAQIAEELAAARARTRAPVEPVPDEELVRSHAGGSDDERQWSADGWRARHEQGLEAPLSWSRNGDGWVRRRFGHVEPAAADA